MPTKELTEYGKWLEFHNLNHSDFTKFGDDVEKKVEWYPYDLNLEYQELFKPFRLYSQDSSYFIDLDSYSLVLEKENGKLISYGSEIDRKVQVVKTNDSNATTLLFCGTDCYPETANWLTDSTVEILGFTLVDERFVPTKWKIDLNNMLFTKYRADKTFSKMPDSYMELERLKEIEFKE
ncbi:hypothetical protein [Aequorivita sinensis]|nr:hypothetical protein [Aequorivita sinensis]